MRIFSYMNNILVFDEKKFYDSSFFNWPQMLCIDWRQDWVCNLYLNQGLCTPGKHAGCQFSVA